MNRILVGPPTRLSKLESRELRAPLYVYCCYVMTRQGWFTVKWRNEVDTNEHGMFVVPAIHDHARSQSFNTDKYKSSDTNLRHMLSVYFDFQVHVSTIRSHNRYRKYVSQHISSFRHIIQVSDICCIHCSETSANARNQQNRVEA